MSKHTPGPWICGWELDTGDYDAGLSVTAWNRGVVAEISDRRRNAQYCQHNPNEETLANAALIAAAPELLEACEAGIKFILAQYETLAEQRAIKAELGVGEWEAFMPEPYHQFIAAIRKAKGEI